MPSEPSEVDFCAEMVRIIRKNSLTKGDSWKTCDLEFLFDDKLREERKEVDDEVHTPITHRFAFNSETTDIPKLRKEIIDEANVLYFLWARLNSYLSKSEELK